MTDNTERIELPADWRYQIGSADYLSPSVAAVRGMVELIESWRSVSSPEGGEPTPLPPFVLGPAMGDPSTEDEEDEDGQPLPGTNWVGWDMSWGCRINFGQRDGDLLFTLSISDMAQKRGVEQKTVTPRQLRQFARKLADLADLQAPACSCCAKAWAWECDDARPLVASVYHESTCVPCGHNVSDHDGTDLPVAPNLGAGDSTTPSLRQVAPTLGVGGRAACGDVFEDSSTTRVCVKDIGHEKDRKPTRAAHGDGRGTVWSRPGLLEVDDEAGAWYIRLSDEEAVRTTDQPGPVHVDWSRDGRMVGVEILSKINQSVGGDSTAGRWYNESRWFDDYRAAESGTVAEVTDRLVTASSEWDDETGDAETARPYLEHLAQAVESWLTELFGKWRVPTDSPTDEDSQ